MTKFIMMCGLPASGKSYAAETLSMEYDATIHSSDALRKEMFGDENTNDKNEEVFKELHNRIKADLKNNKNTIYDATNINYKQRKAFLEELKKYPCEKICNFVATPYKDCLIQNTNRERQVPEHVIKRMYMNFYIPQKYEGWDDIEFVWNVRNNEWSCEDLFKKLDTFNQDNPHHTLTLGDHLRECGTSVFRKGNIYLAFAAFLHDIGKPFVKTFKNMKGEYSNVAHYYQHHLVGAYDAMFYFKNSDDYIFSDKEILEMCNYIQWHMQPYFIETEKAKTKFINLVGQDFYNNLMIINSADQKAH